MNYRSIVCVWAICRFERVPVEDDTHDIIIVGWHGEVGDKS